MEKIRALVLADISFDKYRMMRGRNKMENNSGPVLAMYDIRGKQEFIYKCNRLKEIAGASFVIRDCFKDYLYPVAMSDAVKMELKLEINKGIFHDDNTPFTKEGFAKHIEDGYVGEVVYEGGGNFLLLYKDADTFKKVTYHFTRELIEKVGTLRVLGTYISDVNFDDYEADRKRLYKKHHENEWNESNIAPCATLPIVQVDRRTSLPLVEHHNTVANVIEKVSKESLVKYKKYEEECQNTNMGEVILDKIVRKKGEDSLLAIIYIDGNNMGAQVEKRCEGKTSYKDCVKELRQFSKEIQKDYIDDRMKNIDKKLEDKYQSSSKRRLVIGAGDEINIICNAHDAFDCVKEYLMKLPEGCSSCAGVAVFHSHAPYADVYRIAEECCETGKDKMKELGLKEASFMDFHYCRGAIGVSLEDARKIDADTDISRPWLIKLGSREENKFNLVDVDTVTKMQKILNAFGRTNVKGLLSAAKNGDVELEMELMRIKAHMSEEKRKTVDFAFLDGMDKELRRKLIYDMVTVYDLWFTKE